MGNFVSWIKTNLGNPEEGDSNIGSAQTDDDNQPKSISGAFNGRAS